MTLQLLHSEFPYIWGKFYILCYQCTNNIYICISPASLPSCNCKSTAFPLAIPLFRLTKLQRVNTLITEENYFLKSSRNKRFSCYEIIAALPPLHRSIFVTLSLITRSRKRNPIVSSKTDKNNTWQRAFRKKPDALKITNLLKLVLWILLTFFEAEIFFL